MAKAKGRKTARRKAAPARATRRSTSASARARATAPAGLRPTSQAPSLTVNDIAQSLAWYCDVVGFKVTQRWEHQGALMGAELSAGPVIVYLAQDDWKKGRDRVKGEGVRVYWYTNQDIDQVAAGIKARGGTLSSEPHDEWGSRSFTLEDPTGYRITISSAR